MDAVIEAMSELRDIRGPRPVTRAELEMGRAALTRGYPRNFETAEQISRGAAQLALYGLPDDYFSTFVPKVMAVDEGAVTRVASEHIDPSRLLTVLVGDQEKIGPTRETRPGCTRGRPAADESGGEGTASGGFVQLTVSRVVVHSALPYELCPAQPHLGDHRDPHGGVRRRPHLPARHTARRNRWEHADGEISPLVRAVANVLFDALRGY